jgi:acetate kinase
VADAVLTFNAGSSSLKFALFKGDEPDRLTLVSHGEVEAIGSVPRSIRRRTRAVRRSSACRRAGSDCG